jgi:hypothetical protein
MEGGCWGSAPLAPPRDRAARGAKTTESVVTSTPDPTWSTTNTRGRGTTPPPQEIKLVGKVGFEPTTKGL